jgi:hypothetical protein
MDPETQSDKAEHRASEMERFFSYQEIWYKQYVRPAIKEDVSTEFAKCSRPIIEKMKGIETRLLIKTIAFIIIIVIMLLFTAGT